jgi:hypothetical protein
MPREFIIGNSTFKASPNMIPCFKKPAHGEMPADKKFCNNKIAKPRVKSEHCIGILKGRFQFLKQIRIRIGGKGDTKITTRLVMICCILQNLLIDEKMPDEWYSPDGYDSEEDTNRLDKNDEVNLPVNPNSGDLHRTQLSNYLVEACR